MARVLGVNLPDDKRVEYALTLLYGIGWGNVGHVLTAAKVDINKKVKDLTEDELKNITTIIETNYKVEGLLREEISSNIKRLKEIGSYRGIRHAKSLPVYGQRTKSNARTKRGKRKTVGALKKADAAKIQTSVQAAKK